MKRESYLNYAKRWNQWRKMSKDPLIVKIMVLLHLIESPSMKFYF